MSVYFLNRPVLAASSNNKTVVALEEKVDKLGMENLDLQQQLAFYKWNEKKGTLSPSPSANMSPKRSPQRGTTVSLKKDEVSFTVFYLNLSHNMMTCSSHVTVSYRTNSSRR